MSGARSRNKGAKWERDAAALLAEVFPDAKRGIGQTRMGSDGADVEGTPYWVECKVGQRPNIYAAIEQSVAATDGRPWLVVSRKNSTGGGVASVDAVTMSVESLLSLLRRVQSECPCRHCRGLTGVLPGCPCKECRS